MAPIILRICASWSELFLYTRTTLLEILWRDLIINSVKVSMFVLLLLVDQELDLSRKGNFFVCPIFVDARSRYLPANSNNLTTRDLLFGMENKQTTALFMQVQEFIVESGGFARN